MKQIRNKNINLKCEIFLNRDIHQNLQDEVTLPYPKVC